MELEDKKICGIIMPISSIDGCNENHWSEVLSIIQDVIRDIDFKPNLVSNADDAGVIHKRIIQNIYENPVVVCDVSANNPNVMFELGMRLAFDKPTIIVKDNKTKYSFDTSSIEHIEYPRDLRFTDIVYFKNKLKEKILNTYDKSQKDPEYSTFLKHFGTFQVAKIDTKEVAGDVLILDEIRSLRHSISRLEINTENSKVITRMHPMPPPSIHEPQKLTLYASPVTKDMVSGILRFENVLKVTTGRISSDGDREYINIYFAGVSKSVMEDAVTSAYPVIDSIPF